MSEGEIKLQGMRSKYQLKNFGNASKEVLFKGKTEEIPEEYKSSSSYKLIVDQEMPLCAVYRPVPRS